MAAAAASTPPPSSGSSRSNVKVLCRFRPMNSKEKEMGTTSVIEVPGGGKHGVVKLLVRGCRCSAGGPFALQHSAPSASALQAPTQTYTYVYVFTADDREELVLV